MLTSRLRQASESFWVLPTLLSAAAVVLAELLLGLDRHLAGDSLWIFDNLSATGSRALLTTVGGSMLGVAATSFSITISVLATTSSTYGPRLVRNFMADRGNQLVLAVFTSSFVYCLVVLRSVRSGADGEFSVEAFVPAVAVHVAVLIALVDVAVLVYFIHHIASSVQVTSLQGRVAGELDDVVRLLYPDEPAPPTTSGVAAPSVRATWSSVRCRSSGYVRTVATDRIVTWAGDHAAVVDALATPGSHVVAGEVLARVSVELDDDAQAHLRAAFELGPARTPHQDAAYAVQQLTEMAVRALSPGTNDPYTAIGALDALTPGLVYACARPDPSPAHLDHEGRVRLLLHPVSPQELVRPVFAAIRAWGWEHTIVVLAALELSRRLLAADAEGAAGPRAAAVRAESAALVERYRTSHPHPLDAARVEAALDAVTA